MNVARSTRRPPIACDVTGCHSRFWTREALRDHYDQDHPDEGTQLTEEQRAVRATKARKTLQSATKRRHENPTADTESCTLCGATLDGETMSEHVAAGDCVASGGDG